MQDTILLQIIEIRIQDYITGNI